MSNLHDLYKFKQTARQLGDLLALTIKNQHTPKADELLPLLVRNIGGNLRANQLLKVAERLADELDQFNGKKVSHNQILQALTHSFYGSTFHYQDHLRSVFSKPLDFRLLFGLPLMAPSNMLQPGEEVMHPFPRAMGMVPFLKPWRDVWESYPISTYERPFIPPMPPAACFEGKVGKVEQYQDWRALDPNTSTIKDYIFNGNAAVIVSTADDAVLGCVKWDWWIDFTRYCLSGVTTHFLTWKDNELIHIDLDIRPGYEMPTKGPHIMKHAISKPKTRRLFDTIIRELREIIPRSEDE